MVQEVSSEVTFELGLKHLGEGNGTPLQYSCLENPMDGGAWEATVLGVAKSWTRLSNFTLKNVCIFSFFQARVLGGGFRMGNTCTHMVDSC